MPQRHSVFSKEEKLTWVEIIFNDVKGGVKRMAFPPQFQRNKTQRASPTMCRGRGMIWNGRQGVTGAAVEDVVASWIHISALGSVHLFFGGAN